MAVKNKFKQRCSDCGDWVLEGAGFIWKDPKTGKWNSRHPACEERYGEATPGEPGMKAAVTDEQLDAASEKVLRLMVTRFADFIPELVEDNMLKATRKVEIKLPELPPVEFDNAHHMMVTLVQAVKCGSLPMLVGPTGSGKTECCRQVAKALGLEFYMEARVTSEYKLFGFIDAHGNVVRTAFREAYEHGGVFLFDEVDASDPDALTAINAALSNGVGAFPDGTVEMHKDFISMAAANTYGRGADRQYVGRHQLDAATLDRYDIFEFGYDEAFERAITPNEDWTRWVQLVRKAVEKAGVRHIVSPRASIRGGKMLLGGMDIDVVAEATVWKGLDATNRQRVEAVLKELEKELV